MGKRVKGQSVTKTTVKQPNSFEKLVQLKNSAEKKKSLKLQNSENQKELLTARNKKIFEGEHPQAFINGKKTKKKLFDIESDNDNYENPLFVQNVIDFKKEEAPKSSREQNERRSKKEIYQDVIRNSKLKKMEKYKSNEKLESDIKELEEQFLRIRSKLVYEDPQIIKESKFSKDPAYFAEIENFKNEEKLKPHREVRVSNPKKNNKETREIEEEGSEDSEIRASCDSDYDRRNPEVEDYEEEEFDRKYKTHENAKVEKSLKKMSNSLTLLKKFSTKIKESEDSEEIDLDSSDEESDDPQEDSGKEPESSLEESDDYNSDNSESESMD